ncbi:monofunctional biosynthetic peptidoglycan transglycosylase [Methylopila sp. Yamaguchi]|uniref:monofunctional biosynthetic peptidoglycan transglycosylase n=1 Tax=Methylopila sp. Yamaguchi TaxID=1437817 RepID=UPI000CCC5BD0|nr:monofunctional biosynthetic peptidoglycan transglycosylase [Methylopila sp. Yamaguchi]
MYGFGTAAVRGRPSVLRKAVVALLLIAATPFVLTLIYTVVPPVSTPMLARWLTLRPVTRTWVPLANVSPALPRAVIVSEDARFCVHAGVDWQAISLVMDRDGGPNRGASTITMQVAKNLFLWQGAPYLRKPFEIVLAHWIDLVWSKRRVMEVYLNIAEWGPDGVFGAEAGARRAFGKSAARLSAREAAVLTAALPNPVLRDPKRPSRHASTLASVIIRRAGNAAGLTGCLAR